MAVGMFRTGGDNTSTTGGVTVTVAPGVGLPGKVDYGQIPSDLLINTDIQREFFLDFMEIFRESQAEDDGRLERQTQAAEWLRVLGEYAVGNATEEDLKAVDVSDLAEMPGWSEYYSGVVGEEVDTSKDASAISDEDAISTVMAKVPDQLKGLITEDNIIKVLEEVAKINDPMAQIKRDMGAGVEIEIFKDWRTWKVFGPLAIPGVPLPPGIIDVTLGDIEKAVQNAGEAVEGAISSVGDFVNKVLTDPTGTLKDIGTTIMGTVKGVVDGTIDDPWGGTMGGFEGWVKGILGNVVGGAVLTDIYDTAKGLIEPKDIGTTAVVGGTDTDTDDKEDSTDRFSQILGTVQDTLKTDDVVDIGADSTLDDDTTTTVGGDPNSTDVFSSLLGTVTSNLEVTDTKKSDDTVLVGGDLNDSDDDYPARGTYASAYCETRGDTGGTLVTSYHDGAGGTYSKSSFSSSCKTTIPGGGATVDDTDTTKVIVGSVIDDSLNYDDEPVIEIGGTEQPEAATGGGSVGGGQASASPFLRGLSYTPTVPLAIRPTAQANFAAGLLAPATPVRASGLMSPSVSMDALGQLLFRNMKA